jgi:hypothetical protein
MQAPTQGTSRNSTTRPSSARKRQGVAVHHHGLVQMGRGDAERRLFAPLHDELALREQGLDVEACLFDQAARVRRRLGHRRVKLPGFGGHVGAQNGAQGFDLLVGHLGEGIVIGLHRWRQRRPCRHRGRCGGQRKRQPRGAVPPAAPAHLRPV